jgi:hypothetical protein
MSPLILKRAPIGWNQDDYDVLEDGVIDVSLRSQSRRRINRGCGRAATIARYAAPTATSRRERPRWRRSRRAGGASNARASRQLHCYKQRLLPRHDREAIPCCRIRSLAQAMDRRKDIRLDQSQSSLGARLRTLCHDRHGLHPPRHDPHHVKATCCKRLVMTPIFSDGFLVRNYSECAATPTLWGRLSPRGGWGWPPEGWPPALRLSRPCRVFYY